MIIYKVYCVETSDEFYYASKPSTDTLKKLGDSMGIDKWEEETDRAYVKGTFEVTKINVRK